MVNNFIQMVKMQSTLLGDDNVCYRIHHWWPYIKTGTEWLAFPREKIQNSDFHDQISKKNKAGHFITYILDLDGINPNEKERCTNVKKGDLLLIKTTNFELTPVVPTQITFRLVKRNEDEPQTPLASRKKISCEVYFRNEGFPHVKNIAIVLDSVSKHQKYSKMLQFESLFEITGLTEDRIGFSLHEQNSTLFIYDCDEFQGEEINLRPVGTDQQIEFVVKEVLSPFNNDGKILLKTQESFEWRRKELNGVFLIPLPQMERQLNICQGRNIVIKDISLAKESNSSLDIGFSYSDENGKLYCEYGYKNVILAETPSVIEGKGTSKGRKAFLIIGVITVILAGGFSFFRYHYQKPKVKK